MTTEHYPAVVGGRWINAKEYTPMCSGWFLTVIVRRSTGARTLLVDYFCTDDQQWSAEYHDPAVSVTHYRVLPSLPPEGE